MNRPATKILTAHSSGRWDRNDEPAFDRNVQRMRTGGRTIVTRTELSNRDGAQALRIPEDGWGVWHPRTEYGWANCSVEWDQDAWRATDRGLVQLTEIRITTKGGHLLPPSLMPWVLLSSRLEADLVALVSVAHNNLDNTPKRAAAWRDEADTFRGFQRRMSTRLRRVPQRIVRLHQADVNKNSRLERDRAIIRTQLLAGTGLRDLWGKPATYPRQGTHGRKLLDHAFCNRPGSVRLLADDSSSDHRPIGVTVQL